MKTIKIGDSTALHDVRPLLAINHLGDKVVLLYGDRKGVVVWSTDNEVGYWSDSWSLENFSLFKGQIALENDI